VRPDGLPNALVVVQKDSIVGLGADVEQHLRVLLPPAPG
jgi:hypothetical protein